MRLLCFGAGAIGTYLGGSLALSGHQVVFLERPRTALELRDRGLRLDLSGRGGDPGPQKVPASAVTFVGSAAEAVQAGPFDLTIFALKSFDAQRALDSIQPWADILPPIACFSNGVDSEATIAGVVGKERVIAATVTSAVGRRATGDIVLERMRGVGIHVSLPGSRRLLQAAQAAGLQARGFNDAAAMKWSKMFTNLIANPTAAILDMTAADVLAHPGLYALEIGMLRECLAVMRAKNIPLTDLPGTPVRALAWATRLPAWMSQPVLARTAGAGRGGKMPSFHIDLHSGRGESEVAYLHGAVAREGGSLGVPTPINAWLTRTLLGMTEGRIPVDRYAGKPEALLAAAQG